MTIPTQAISVGWALMATVVLAACSGGGPGDENDLADALTRYDLFTEEQAQCIAERIFDNYGGDEETIAAISNADSVEELNEAAPDFADNFETYQTECD